ncbi:MAG TPA: hypothetical protein VGS58_13670, partial [Candidatus Sulfopaludibacter sp.]|nr:hypothetical protein [Candidatus Sulfopaludibacter sp.]
MSAGTTLFGIEAHVQDRPPASTERREAVLEQLGRILGSPLFKHSRHYPAFLRHVVERTLEGQENSLKERAIGIEVFGRGRDYDTNLDPVVRTSACEVRKRVAQYYHEYGQESEVRIDLHTGSYVPEFRFPESPAALPRPVTRVPRRWWRWPGWRVVAACLAVPLVLLGLGAVMRAPSSALDQFWASVWGASDTLMLCMGGVKGWTPPNDHEMSVNDIMKADRLAFGDAVTMARLTGLLRASHKKYDIRRGEDFTLTEFRKGPVVLIGAFNN